jgi:hypothetical protein
MADTLTEGEAIAMGATDALWPILLVVEVSFL